VTPDPTDSRFRDPQRKALHEELTAPTEADDQSTDGAEMDELAADMLLPGLDATMLSPTVQGYVRALLTGGENPTPGTRQKLVAAASRGLAHRRADTAPLPGLLLARRVDKELTVPDLAAKIHVSDKELHDMEAGNLTVRSLGAQRVVDWVRALDVQPEEALPALRRALKVSTTTSARLAAGTGRRRDLLDDDEKFLNEVARLLAS